MSDSYDRWNNDIWIGELDPNHCAFKGTVDECEDKFYAREFENLRCADPQQKPAYTEFVVNKAKVCTFCAKKRLMDLDKFTVTSWLAGSPKHKAPGRVTTRKYHMINTVILAMAKKRDESLKEDDKPPRYVCLADRPDLSSNYFVTPDPEFTEALQQLERKLPRCEPVESKEQFCTVCTRYARTEGFVASRPRPWCWSNGMKWCCPLSNPDHAGTIIWSSDVIFNDGSQHVLKASSNCKLSDVVDNKTLCISCWDHTKKNLHINFLNEMFIDGADGVGRVSEPLYVPGWFGGLRREFLP
jgi:hypothetical protein